ncbi:MAG: CRISPR-associated endonuclease Cas2 [Eubacteriales bacterium]|nr:CRISPR-associated endonuclease Cas2 [Eubacteriales bacterium]MDD3883238.1 CRISPR-associated endonuclease Cas2 [Eubacteriales bacterium]MDD4513840.1 CRISPR-associated endonuclease Cas2 [Eubacteriales bacterium]
MLILVTYDINTSSDSGVRRLNRVAKQCLRYGVRVQCSVFECRIDSTQLAELKHSLEHEINPDEDSVRFYRLGENAEKKVTVLGVSRGLNPADTLIL